MDRAAAGTGLPEAQRSKYPKFSECPEGQKACRKRCRSWYWPLETSVGEAGGREDAQAGSMMCGSLAGKWFFCLMRGPAKHEERAKCTPTTTGQRNVALPSWTSMRGCTIFYSWTEWMTSGWPDNWSHSFHLAPSLLASPAQNPLFLCLTGCFWIE